MAAAQCAQRALESERFDTARHLAQRGLAWNNGSLYASAALMLHLWDILARCAQSAGPGQEETAFADYRQAYAAQPVRARYHLAMARYQLERGKTAAAEAELRAVLMPPEESRAEYRVLQARLASASGRYAEARPRCGRPSGLARCQSCSNGSCCRRWSLPPANSRTTKRPTNAPPASSSCDARQHFFLRFFGSCCILKTGETDRRGVAG